MAKTYGNLDIAPVINAAGKMTALGGTAQATAVADAQSEAAQWHVDLAGLRSLAGSRIAEITGAEAASVTTGAAAGIAISVAAVIAGIDTFAAFRLPLTDSRPNKVLLQAGHQVNFGASVEQMIRLGGGDPQIIGSAAHVPVTALVDALGDTSEIAAFLFVQSHHAVQENMILLDQAVKLCHAAEVPVIVDAAAEDDLTRYISMGVDLVTYSGGKAIGGPTAGFIAGSEKLVEACELQTRGIARAMKVGKEQIAGLMTALETYVQRDLGAIHAKCDRVNEIILAAIAGSAELAGHIRSDEAGRSIARVAVEAADGGFDIRDLVAFLASGSPSVRTRNHHLDEGIVLFDPRELSEDQAHMIAKALSKFES